MDLPTILAIAGPTALVSLGAAYGGAKQALNGTRERVRKVEANAIAHEEKDQQRHVEVIDRLARIETKLEKH